MGTTAELADLIVGTGFEQFSPAAVEKGKEAFLDWIGVTLAALKEPAGEIILDFVREQGGNPQATVIGAGLKTSATNAALAMGVLSHALDYDDLLWPMIGHPSVTLLPAVFALGEMYGASGKKALEAFILGFEVDNLVGMATTEFHYHKGWHATSTIGPLGVAAAGARILGLDHDRTCMALGLAASHAGGLRSNFGTMTKPLHAGNAARGGVASVLLAAGGFTASKSILEDGAGFANVFCGKDQHKLKETSFGRRAEWAVVKPGRQTKKYPSCGGTHTAIDGMLAICRENDLQAGSIKKIECLVNEAIPNVLIYPRPETGLEGKFSLQYCLAAAVLDGGAGLKQFTDEMVLREDVRQMLPRIEMITRPTKIIRETTIKVETVDGNTIEKTILDPKGTPENPLSYEELLDKFTVCVEDVLSRDKIEEVIEQVNNLEHLDNIGTLVELLRP